MKKVAVIGLGYVGFPLACAIDRNEDYEVRGFDVSDEKIEALKGQEASFEVSDSPGILKGTEVFVLCVPTPLKEDNQPDLAPLEEAVKLTSEHLEKGALVIVESTVNPGVCEEIVIPLIEKETGMKVDEDFELAHCPERISPGDPKWNVTNIPRNVGASSKEACKRAADFYRSFLEAEVNEVSSLKVAEAIKIVENTFRDINIAYVNELAKSFDVLGIDLLEVIQGASNKPFAFLPHYPSCGVGGHCIPVDPYYLIERANKSGFEHSFLSLAREVNNSMPAYTVELLSKEFDLKGAKVGVLGLSYKADVEDTRQSPSAKIIELLESEGATVETFDPYLKEASTQASVDELLSSVEVIILATDHQEFKTLTPADFEAKGIKVLVDGKNMFNKVEFKGSQIIYKGIGRG